jgi:hypothetical protein
LRQSPGLVQAFRRGPRRRDHAAFYHALKAGCAVNCAFVAEFPEALSRRVIGCDYAAPITPLGARGRWSLAQEPVKTRDGIEA